MNHIHNWNNAGQTPRSRAGIRWNESPLTPLFLAVACIALAAGSASADDVKVQPAAGSGFVVTDQAGSTERLRVNEAGGVSLPGLPTSASPNNGVCRDPATGQLGTCAVPDAFAWGAYVKRVSVTKYLSCDQPSICPLAEQDGWVTASCPATTPGGGTWWAVAVECTEPVSLNLDYKLPNVNKIHVVGSDGYQHSVRVPASFVQKENGTCSYSGFMGAFSIETLTTKVLCIREP